MSVVNNLTGKTLSNRYEILRPLGEGGMGKVYLANDKRFGKQVVVKVPTMETGDKDFKDRFMREIASLATLEHPHIVTTVDWGEIEGIPFLVLRYLSGGSLRDRITDAQGYYKPMPLEDLNQWLPQIASGLDFIHTKNWVHRDLKPDNILFDEVGNPYLADFGIAKALEGAPMGVKTTVGTSIGTPQYMAPEMHLGKGIGPRADQFGLAVLVYEALAGKIPFAGATPTAIFVEVMQDKARPIHELVPGIPLEKSKALMKGIAKEPIDRYSSCVEFANTVTGSMLARGSSSASSETPSRVIIPGTRLETTDKPDIPGTRIETPSKPEIAGTKLERIGDNHTVKSETLPHGRRLGNKGNSSLTFNLGAGIRKRGVLSGIALLGILIITFIILLGGKKSTPTLVEDLNKELKLEMVLIPAGKFMMGSPASEKFMKGSPLSEKGQYEYDKELLHEVTLTKPYYIGKYEVTQEQWQAVIGDNPSSVKGPRLPVTNVSWDDCQEFIKKLNAKTKGGYRLPTEAEWEYACRAETTTAYSFGNKITRTDANYTDSIIYRPLTVGSYEPNGFGLYDMHGNVHEWCEDWYAAYPEQAVTDPKGPTTGKYRVLRGGGCLSGEWGTRSSFRNNFQSSDWSDQDSGFRLARTSEIKAIVISNASKPDTTKETPATFIKPVKVAFVSNNSADFWTIVEAGARKAEHETGAQLIFKQPLDGLVSTQKQIMEDLMAQGVNAISVNVIRPEIQTSLINEIAERIPVLCVNDDAVKSKRRCFLGTANLQAGRAVGELVKEVMPQGGKIAIFVGLLEPMNAQERRQGLLDVLEGLNESNGLRGSTDGKKYGNYELIGTYTDDVDKNKAKDNAAEVLMKNQNEENLCMIGLWSYNPPAILEAVKDSRRIGKVKIVGFDENDNTLEAIKNGEIYGAFVQQPFEFGYRSVKLMVELVTKPESAKIPANRIIDLPHKTIKKENVEAFHANLKKLLNK